jgi:hypothetical protein
MRHNHIKETAKAWNLSYIEVSDIFTWVDVNVDTDNRSKALCSLLRRKYRKPPKIY